MAVSAYEFDSAVRGFHQYQSIWAPVLGEELLCKHESHNPHDSFAIAVTKDHVVVGHLPRKYSALFWSFLRSGSITCIITETRRYSRDLVQGGLEVLCMLKFKGETSKIEKVKGLLKENTTKIASIEAESNNDNTEVQPIAGNDHAMTKDTEVISDQQIFSSPKRQKTDCESEWVCLGGMRLQIKDKNIIIKGEN